MRNCTGCGEQIHPKRLEIMPTTNRCVACSTVQKKGAVTIMKGTGDHTWVETIHLEHDDYKSIWKQKTSYVKTEPLY
jgi:RNA polymerase-binding transcription factor DksA